MPVYVDDMFRYAMGLYRRRGRSYRMSHMISDTDNELHAMAQRIGVNRKWHQGDHYDITMTKRKLAIKHGAIPITLRICAIMIANRRAGFAMGTPKTCLTISKKRTKHAQILAQLL
jgi:hypothetical protein